NRRPLISTLFPYTTLFRSFIVLGNFTDQGIRNVKETTKRAEAFKAAAKKVGANVKELYWTMGQYDLVTVVEAPDDETATSLLLRSEEHTSELQSRSDLVCR